MVLNTTLLEAMGYSSVSLLYLYMFFLRPLEYEADEMVSRMMDRFTCRESRPNVHVHVLVQVVPGRTVNTRYFYHSHPRPPAFAIILLYFRHPIETTLAQSATGSN